MEDRLALIAMPKCGIAARWLPQVLRAQMRSAPDDKRARVIHVVGFGTEVRNQIYFRGIGSTRKYPSLPPCNFSRINRALFHQGLRRIHFRLFTVFEVGACFINHWTFTEKSSGAPDALLRVQAGIHQRLVVPFGGVVAKTGGGLGPKS